MNIDAFALIAEQRIRAAEKEGAFDNLPGKGKPIDFSEDAGLPPEIRMMRSVLKNAGFVAPEIALKREIAELSDVIRACTDEDRRTALSKRRSELECQLGILMDRQRASAR